MNAVLPAHFADSLLNLTTGLGVLGTDKAVAGSYYYRPRLTQTTIRALYDQSWLGKRAVDLHADAATSAWRTWQGSPAVVEVLEQTEKRLQLQQKLCHALRLARRDGGSVLLIGTAGGNPAEPLDAGTIAQGGLRFVHVFSRTQISCGEIIRDPWSPWFGMPTEFRLFAANGQGLTIHPSRCIIFTGPGADPYERGEPWGQSVLETVHDAIRDIEATLQAVQALVQELRVDVVSIPNLTTLAMDPDNRKKLVARFGLAASLKSIRNVLLMDGQERWNTKQLNLTGIPELIDRLMIVCAGALQIPATLLWGRAPAGENSTGESDLENFYRGISDFQRTTIDPALATLNDCIVRSALGRKPRTAPYPQWNSLWSLAETDLAKIRREHAEAAKALADGGLVDKTALARAVVGQAETDGWLPGLAQFTSEAAKQAARAETTPSESEA